MNDGELATKLERVDELVSLMLDDELDNERVSELESLLLDSREARAEYVGMVQLHADLLEYYNPKPAGSTVPVLAAIDTPTDTTTPAEPAE